MRRFLILGSVSVVAIVGWLLLDADPEGRQELVDRIGDAFGGDAEEAEPATPNWGDVATKVGEFAEEERALRSVLNPAFGGEIEGADGAVENADGEAEPLP